MSNVQSLFQVLHTLVAEAEEKTALFLDRGKCDLVGLM